MSFIKPNNNRYAVCIKTCELISQQEPTIKLSLLLGDLVQMCGVCYIDFDRCIIQRFDREAKIFENTLYQCETKHLSGISNGIWPFIHNITVGSFVKILMALSCERQVIVNFQVKFFGKHCSLGADQFYGLQLMPTPNITKENIMQLNEMYLSPTLCLIILRADRFILNLVADLGNNKSNNHFGPKIHRTEKTIYITDRSTIDDDFIPKSSQSQKATQISNDIEHPYLSNMKRFVLPKLNEIETNCATEGCECKNSCFGCDNNVDRLIQFTCQHMYCFECVMELLSDHELDSMYCPFKIQNFNCRYKITDNDVRHILDVLNGQLGKESLSSKTGRVRRVLCQCPNYKQWKKVDDHAAINYDETLPRVPVTTLNLFDTWTCTYCTYGENRIETIKCVVCHKTNNKLKRKSNNTEYYRLVELEKNDTFIPNAHQFYCTFCDQTIAPDDGVILRSCLHNVCRNCIVSYIESQDEVEIKCPHTMCSHLIQDREIKTLISPEAYASLQKSKNENGYHYWTPNCNGF